VNALPINGKAIITGASGFIGGRLRDQLLDHGLDVVAIRRAGSPEPKRGRSVVANYADTEGLVAIMTEEKPDYVFHVAGATKGRTYQDFERANVMPTVNLLAALDAAHRAVKRFVLVSSLTSYGPATPDRPLTEGDPRQPIEFYGRSKLQAEEAVEANASLPWTILRPSGVYGPGDRDYFELFKSVSQGMNVFFGNHQRWFSAIYVDDCVRALVEAAATENTVGRGYFLCDGRPITWGDFQQLIVDNAERKVRTMHLPEFLVPLAAVGGEMLTAIDKKPRLFNRQKAKMGAQAAWTCTHEAARTDFGYTPAISVEEGVKRTLHWYRENGWC